MESITQLNWAIAEAIRKAREAKGMSQDQLAGFAGFSEVYLSELERGKKRASLNILLLIARALGIRLSEFVCLIERILEQGPPEQPRKRGRPGKVTRK